MSDVTCAVEVWDGWRGRTCGRPIKRDGMCGIHASAKERREKNAADRAAKYAERRQRDQERIDRREAGEAALAIVERVRALADELEERSRGFSGLYAEADREYAAALRAIIAATPEPLPVAEPTAATTEASGA